MIFIFLSCHEEAHDNKESCCENSKPCDGSGIMTHYVELWYILHTIPQRLHFAKLQSSSEGKH